MVSSSTPPAPARSWLALLVVTLSCLACTGTTSDETSPAEVPEMEAVATPIATPTAPPPAAPTIDPTPVTEAEPDPTATAQPTPTPTSTPVSLFRPVDAPAAMLESETLEFLALGARVDGNGWLIGGRIIESPNDIRRPTVWQASDLDAETWTPATLPVADHVHGQVNSLVSAPVGDVLAGWVAGDDLESTRAAVWHREGPDGPWRMIETEHPELSTHESWLWSLQAVDDGLLAVASFETSEGRKHRIIRSDDGRTWRDVPIEGFTDDHEIRQLATDGNRAVIAAIDRREDVDGRGARAVHTWWFDADLTTFQPTEAAAVSVDDPAIVHFSELTVIGDEFLLSAHVHPTDPELADGSEWLYFTSQRGATWREVSMDFDRPWPTGERSVADDELGVLALVRHGDDYLALGGSGQARSLWRSSGAEADGLQWTWSAGDDLHELAPEENLTFRSWHWNDDGLVLMRRDGQPLLHRDGEWKLVTVDERVANTERWSVIGPAVHDGRMQVHYTRFGLEEPTTASFATVDTQSWTPTHSVQTGTRLVGTTGDGRFRLNTHLADGALGFLGLFPRIVRPPIWAEDMIGFNSDWGVDRSIQAAAVGTGWVIAGSTGTSTATSFVSFFSPREGSLDRQPRVHVLREASDGHTVAICPARNGNRMVGLVQRSDAATTDAFGTHVQRWGHDVYLDRSDGTVHEQVWPNGCTQMADESSVLYGARCDEIVDGQVAQCEAHLSTSADMLDWQHHPAADRLAQSYASIRGAYPFGDHLLVTALQKDGDRDDVVFVASDGELTIVPEALLGPFQNRQPQTAVLLGDVFLARIDTDLYAASLVELQAAAERLD